MVVIAGVEATLAFGANLLSNYKYRVPVILLYHF